ncbi:MAG: ParB/RepB/Spo0J family partition protein [Pseudomonadota bacterium]
MAASASPKSTSPATAKSSGRGAKAGRGLGRGLDALLGEKPATVNTSLEENTGASGGERQVPIEFIGANPDQPRKIFDADAISDLAGSIREKGLLQPILVRPARENKDGIQYEIVAGERRWRAAQKAQLHEVPVIVRTLTDQETAEIALIENIQRVDLNVMEEADAYHHLAQSYGRTQQQIARAVGKSRSHVANLMRLTDLPATIQNAVRADIISMGHARALLSSEAPEAVFSKVVAGGLSVRETESLVKADQSAADRPPKTGKATPTPAGHKDADTRRLETDLATALGLSVSIDHQKSGAGAVTISYLSLDQLDDVCRRLMGSAV